MIDGRAGAFAISVLFLATFSCGGGGRSPGNEIHVLAASSLRDALTEAAREYRSVHPGIDIRLSAGASNVLARQVEEGAPADIFVSADERTMDRLVRLGRIEPGTVRPIAGNRLVVIGPADRETGIRSAADLGGDTFRSIAIPDTAVPIGRYAESFLRSAGLLAGLERRIVRTASDEGSVAAVEAGAVDAAIVYGTDVRAGRGVRLLFEVPAETAPPVRIVAGLVRGLDRNGPDGRFSTPAAAEFLAFLTDGRGREILRDAGFLDPR